MTSAIYGWTGRILKVDLTGSVITELDTMAYSDRFLGGRGVATKIYWDEVKPEVKAFDPENRLILMSGPLGATGALGASRFEAVSKSPMSVPEGFCYGNMGGYFGPFMKKAGFDGVVVSGRAAGPSYIYIKDGAAEILDASWLWGRGVYETQRLLEEKHGRDVHFVAIGPAGENMVRSATLNTDNEGASTGGFGAVMGSKNLKAVVVTGTGSPAAAYPDKLVELNRLISRLNQTRGVMSAFPRDQVSVVGKSSCYQCGLMCMRNRYRTASGKEAVRKCQSMMVYLPWIGRRPGEPIDTAIDATGICNDLSLCTMEIANVILWLYKADKAGDFTEKETGLDMSRIGSLAFFQQFASMIARREGFGDILAEGLLRVGEKYGEMARAHFTNEVAGVGSGAAYSPREYITNALLYALEPRQPIAMLHEVSRIMGQWVAHQARPEASVVTSDVFRQAARLFWGNDKAWDMTTHEGKAEAATKILCRTYVKDSLLLCDSGFPIMVSLNSPDHIGDPTLESRVFSAVTGIETDEVGLLRYGERIFNLQRAILLREGWQPKTADFPAEFNFIDPVQTGFMNPNLIVPGPGDEVVSMKGKTLDRQAYLAMRDEFYQLRGWDPATGLQKEEALTNLGLSDIAGELNKGGLLA